MSAIFGIIDFEGRPLKEEWIQSMQRDLAHRGPDGQGLYREPSVALGHMLLQVTPESVYDKSPYEEDGLVITANARLDEREVIMDRLDIPKEERDKITDPLLLLRSFKKFGKDFVKDIYGDFAFAIWDKNKRELFCARDQMGVKPFLYYNKDGKFVFSTELKALVNLSFIETCIDYNLLRNQAFNIWDEPEKSAWKNIYRLKPATLLLYSLKSINSSQFWRPKYKPVRNKVDVTLIANNLRNLMEKIINDHTRGLEKVGIPLSGGMDSSTIACLTAKKFKNHSGKVFTVSSILDPQTKKDDLEDEMNYILNVINHADNIIPDFVYHSKLSFHKNLLQKFKRNHSVVNSNHYVDEAIFERLGLRSVRRVLSGIFGDFTISNRFINPYPYLLFHGKFKTLHNLAKDEIYRNNLSTKLFIKKNLIMPLIPYKIAKILFRIKGISTNKGLSEFGLIPDKKDRKKIKRKILKEKKIIFKTDHLITKNIWPTDHEPFYEEYDCESSFYKLELTYPLADRRLVEFLLTVPVQYFRSDGLSRGLLRKAMTKILPEEIRLRLDKITYSPGYHEVLVHEKKIFLDNFKRFETQESLNSLIDIEFLKSKILSLLNSKKSINFDGDYWIVIDSYLFLLFCNYFINKLYED